LYWLALLLAHTGDGLLWVVIVAGLWLQGNAAAARLALVIISIALVVTLIKVSVRRRRPIDARSLATMTLDKHSFPSGHAARTIGLAIVIGGLLPQLWPWLIGWAIGVGLARVALGAHFLSDVIAGWSIGLLVAMILTRVA
jgi:undecaprenyl-diphosphatase